MTVKVAVIGAGVQGLTALKNFKEDGFDVTGYESRDYVGGLWKYTPDTSLSVQPDTVFNSSKFMSAISDFPFPEHVSDYPTAGELHSYLQSYCDQFDLERHIHFDTRVEEIYRDHNKWAVKAVTKNEVCRVDYFDKIAVATGSFSKPRIPEILDIEQFAGTVIHSLQYRGPEEFHAKRVLLLGFHATAQDMVVSLSTEASKVYVAHRNGALMLPRYAPSGVTFDMMITLRSLLVTTWISSFFPRLWQWMEDMALSFFSKKAFPDLQSAWKLDTYVSRAVATPLMADAIYSHLQGGFAVPVASISKVVGHKSIQLVDEQVLDDIDAIIFCTGYSFEIPFETGEYNPYPKTGDPPVLYRNIFPCHEKSDIRSSLAFLGQGSFPFSGFVQLEMQSMAVSQVWQGCANLPSLPRMEDWRSKHLAWRRDMLAYYGNSGTFHPGMLPLREQLQWLDDVAGTAVFNHFSWISLKAWRFWWNDRKLCNMCLGGVLSPAIWRLFDMGRRKPWVGARSQIIQDNELAKQQKVNRVKWMEEQKKKRL